MQTGSGADTASCSLGMAVLSRGLKRSGCDVRNYSAHNDVTVDNRAFVVIAFLTESYSRSNTLKYGTLMQNTVYGV
jgi:hypothetical protein